MASGATEAIEPLPPELPAALTRASAYPEDSGAQRGVGTLQTHISHLFLTTARVYKLRKAVRPGFLDFGTRKARNTDALREIELNRRLAPDAIWGWRPCGSTARLRCWVLCRSSSPLGATTPARQSTAWSCAGFRKGEMR